MNRKPEPHPVDDDAWLRDALRDDLACSPYLDDDGFSARVVQRLPAPRLPWLDGISAALAIGLLALGLWPLLDAAAPTIVHVLADRFDAAARAAVSVAGGMLTSRPDHVLTDTLLTAVAPLLALAAAAFVLAEA
ncbi:MAG: hypothetical protein QM661_00835 [Solimonas sp.]